MKIPCGGFQLNDNDFKFNDNDELSLQQSGGSGGDNVAYAHFTYDNDANKYVCDMTFSDLSDYWSDDVPVIGVMQGYELPMISMDAFNNIATFQLFNVVSGTLSVHTITYSQDGINDAFDSYDLSTLVVNDGE